MHTVRREIGEFYQLHPTTIGYCSQEQAFLILGPDFAPYTLNRVWD